MQIMSSFLSTIFTTVLLFGASSCGPKTSELAEINPNANAVEALDGEGLDPMFHPYDYTLEEIADRIRQGYSRIDLAMYNMEETAKSPVIALLQEEEMQERIQSEEVKIRILFQGYGERQGPVSAALEALGADVRHFASSRDVHHKFGIFTDDELPPVLVTGSANWSMSSYNRYNENLLFIDDHPGVTSMYQAEFEKLWGTTKEFGHDKEFPAAWEGEPYEAEEGMEVYFNSENFDFTSTNISVSKTNPKKFTLTRALVDWIDSAEATIQMATTRINLRPVYDALIRAADRGVEIEIVTNQDQYNDPGRRSKWRLKACVEGGAASYLTACCDKVKDPETGETSLVFDAFEKSCSTSQIHGYFLTTEDFHNSDLIDVRVKLFSLTPSPRNSLSHQMHAKYTIIDDRIVVSGSFNYSVSSEYNHIENVIAFDGARYPLALEEFQANFVDVYGQGRDNFFGDEGFQERFEEAHEEKTKTECDMDTVALTYEEIDHLLSTRTRHKKWSKITAACL